MSEDFDWDEGVRPAKSGPPRSHDSKDEAIRQANGYRAFGASPQIALVVLGAFALFIQVSLSASTGTVDWFRLLVPLLLIVIFGAWGWYSLSIHVVAPPAVGGEHVTISDRSSKLKVRLTDIQRVYEGSDRDLLVGRGRLSVLAVAGKPRPAAMFRLASGRRFLAVGHGLDRFVDAARSAGVAVDQRGWTR